MRTLMPTFWFVLLLWSAGCAITDSNAQIVKDYTAATCISPSVDPRARNTTRVWRNTVILHDGSRVTIKGVQAPGGRIALVYPATNRETIAVDPGDYVYPSDVRLDNRREHLYIKAHGLAGGIFARTWLFEYDLAQHQLLKRIRVSADILPAECADQEAAKRLPTFSR